MEKCPIIKMETTQEPISKERYDLSFEKDLYSIEISKDDFSIFFSGFLKNKISIKKYENSFTLNQLQNFSKIFKICDNINEAKDIILLNFKENKIKLNLEDNILNLSFNYNMLNNKNEEIRLPLKISKMKESIIIEKLIDKIFLLEEKNKQLEDEIKLLKLEIESKNKQLKEEKLIDIIGKHFLKTKYEISYLINNFLYKDSNDLKEEYQNHIVKVLE